MAFLMKTGHKKSLLRLFAIFDFLKIFCFSYPGLVFIFTKRLLKFPSSED
jgi:hypothetical protein